MEKKKKDLESWNFLVKIYSFSLCHFNEMEKKSIKAWNTALEDRFFVNSCKHLSGVFGGDQNLIQNSNSNCKYVNSGNN